jgi:hypothetical protein
LGLATWQHLRVIPDIFSLVLLVWTDGSESSSNGDHFRARRGIGIQTGNAVIFLSFAALLLPIFSIGTFILAMNAVKQSRQDPMHRGLGLAWTGIVVSSIGISMLLYVVGVVIYALMNHLA